MDASNDIGQRAARPSDSIAQRDNVCSSSERLRGL
ncbi:hypothetical protein EV688_1171 [Chromatocurvus halotolerans]|uniref:Uncharacterized protein n=1 Tax=Chromatocurvus halotolerans TaxID=1132028 RepID=A0A4R2KG63_9GAMM|nr:hypothetical protein EV688_1171 [Chromatocurvus halotolerans]